MGLFVNTMKKKKKQTGFIWKPSEYKLSPMEGRIVLEIDEAGSEHITSLAETIRLVELADIDQLLAKFAVAIERLHRLKLITLTRDEKWNNQTITVSLDEYEIVTVFQYLSDCPVTTWFEMNDCGPCGGVEICANFTTRG